MAWVRVFLFGLFLLLAAFVGLYVFSPARSCADMPGNISEGADGVHMACKQLVALCVEDGEQGDAIRKVCPETCGTCPNVGAAVPGQMPSRTCADSPSLLGLVPNISQLGDRIPACPDVKSLCKGPATGPLYKKVCPRTCGVCKAAADMSTSTRDEQSEDEVETAVGGAQPHEGDTNRQCADTAGVISTSTDGVNLKCEHLVAYCADESDKGEGIRRICPHTCGLCTGITAVCKDSPRLHGLIPNLEKFGAADISCKDFRDVCASEEMEGLRKACPKTCGQCPSDKKNVGAKKAASPAAVAAAAACSDAPGKVTNAPDGRPITCAQLVAFCVDPAQGPAIRKKCPATCGACPGHTGPITCADTPRPHELQPDVGGSTCNDLKKKCKDPEDGTAIKQLCPATCKVCKRPKSPDAAAGDREGSSTKEKRAKENSKKTQEKVKKKIVGPDANEVKKASQTGTKKASMKKSKKVKRHPQPEVAQIACEVCTHMVAAAIRGSMEYVPSMTGDDKYARIVGGVCDTKNLWARWISHLDIRYTGAHLQVERQEGEGECNKECATVKKACFHVLRDREEVLEDLLMDKAKPEDIANDICGGHCALPQETFYPRDGWEDEVFEPRDPELVKTELIAEERNLHLPQGAPQSKVWNMKDIMAMSEGDKELWMAQQNDGRRAEQEFNRQPREDL